MFHNREKILARSNMGEGTLGYEIDERGVKFRFDAPNTALGDEALELVRRGDIAGCSFAFSTRYWDESCVSHETEVTDGKVVERYTVRCMLGIYDFTLAADPAYPQTSVAALREAGPTPPSPGGEGVKSQVAAMREAAGKRLL